MFSLLTCNLATLMHSGTANGNDGLTSDMLSYRVTTVTYFLRKAFLKS